MTNREAPKCPWCGKEMTDLTVATMLRQYGKEFISNYACGCGCNAPTACGHTKQEAEEAAYAAAMRRAEPNEPLTLDELRGMDGEPVYIVEHPDWGHWELSDDAEDYLDRDLDFYGLKMPENFPDPMGRYGLHMLGWLAYRRKPTQEERAAPWKEADHDGSE